MSRGQKISDILKPLSSCSEQCYVGVGLHTLGLLGWILEQTGRADIYVSTFSTSEAFLNGIINLHKKDLIKFSQLVVDVKASRKTVHLYNLMKSAFSSVRLTLNHSKILLVETTDLKVTVITSQNQTYGDRAECTLVSTSKELFNSVMSGFIHLTAAETSVLLDTIRNDKGTEIYTKSGRDSRGDGKEPHPDIGDWQPIGI